MGESLKNDVVSNELREGVGENGIVKAEEVALKESEDIVAGLASRNREPVFDRAIGPRPEFGRDFDWEDQRRVIELWGRLDENPASAIDGLLKHLDDDSYCITFKMGRSVDNYSVGEIVNTVLWGCLEGIFTGTFPPNRRFSYLPVPAVDNRIETRAWCKARRGKTLLELQLEAIGTFERQLTEYENEKGMKFVERRLRLNDLRRQLIETGEPIPTVGGPWDLETRRFYWHGVLEE